MAERTIEYMRLDEVQPALVNPKLHAADDLAVSLEEHGYGEPVLLDERTGRLVAGHGRLEALAARLAVGKPAPDGVRVAGDGSWFGASGSGLGEPR